jgi:hypothetical protein
MVQGYSNVPGNPPENGRKIRTQHMQKRKRIQEILQVEHPAAMRNDLMSRDINMRRN